MKRVGYRLRGDPGMVSHLIWLDSLLGACSLLAMLHRCRRRRKKLVDTLAGWLQYVMASIVPPINHWQSRLGLSASLLLAPWLSHGPVDHLSA